MNIIDLFSGAGGLTEGFRHEQFDIKAHVEMDSAAVETLKVRDAFYYLKNRNKISIYQDFLKNQITEEELLENVPNEIINSTLNYEINDDTIETIFNKLDNLIGSNSIDGIIGGPPCQAYSTVGRARNKLKKDSDKRIYLYRYYIDFLQKYKPSFFVFENVRGLLSFKDKSDELLLPKMIKEFEYAGYKLELRLIDSSKFGVSQRRERLIIFGTNGTINPSLFFEELFKTQQQTPLSIEDLFHDLPKLKSGQEVNQYTNKNPKGIVDNFIRINKNIPLTQNISRPNKENDLKIYAEVSEAKQKGISLKYSDIKSGVKTHKNQHSFLDRYKALPYKGISHTIVAHIAKDGHYYIHPDVKQNRSITVREAARIQSFPDDFYFETSRTQAFKQIGNAVPPLLSTKFAKTVERLYKK